MLLSPVFVLQIMPETIVLGTYRLCGERWIPLADYSRLQDQVLTKTAAKKPSVPSLAGESLR